MASLVLYRSYMTLLPVDNDYIVSAGTRTILSSDAALTEIVRIIILSFYFVATLRAGFTKNS